VYFETEKHRLRNKGLLLRVRRIEDRHIQTIKESHASPRGTQGFFRTDNDAVASASRNNRRDQLL
jgi:inorganic triphosphatase YgiF